MRICRYSLPSDNPLAADRLGLVRGESVHDVSPALEFLPLNRWPAPPGDALIAALPDLLPRLEALASPIPLSIKEVTLKSPVAAPSKVICGVGNFPEHGVADPRTLGYLFKVPSAVVGPSE